MRNISLVFIFILVAIALPLAGCTHSPAVQSPVAATRPASPATTAIATTLPAHNSHVLMFNSRSIDAMIAGTKTSTTRKGMRDFPAGTAVANDRKRQIDLIIVSAVQKKLADLSEEDAQTDGSGSVDAMKAALAKNYPGIKPDDTVTVITFRVAPQ